MKKQEKNNPYAKEKFSLFLDGLITSEIGLKERIKNSIIVLVSLEDDDFSDEQKPFWYEIKRIIKSEKPIYDSKGDVVVGIYENSINNLNLEECSNLINKILHLDSLLEWGWENTI